jgi:hypothetical protein
VYIFFIAINIDAMFHLLKLSGVDVDEVFYGFMREVFDYIIWHIFIDYVIWSIIIPFNVAMWNIY